MDNDTETRLLRMENKIDRLLQMVLEVKASSVTWAQVAGIATVISMITTAAVELLRGAAH